MLDQIPKLLFASVVVTLFSFLLFWFAFGLNGNGGQYWGFDGQILPATAAHQEYDVGRYSLLALNVTDSIGNRYRGTPGVRNCLNHPFGPTAASRPQRSELADGLDFENKVAWFAIVFNRSMASMLNQKFDAGCENDHLNPYEGLIQG